MKQAILIHGLPKKEHYYDLTSPSGSNSHWFPWVQHRILCKGMLCQTLEMPHPYDPSYEDHCAVLDQMNISDETILVGHSCGGGFLVRYFSERKDLSPKKIILVAPWLDPDNFLKELNPQSDFFNFSIDPQLTERTEVHMLYSTDDMDSIIQSVERLQHEIPNTHDYVFSDRGHFVERHMGTNEFPELVEVVVE